MDGRKTYISSATSQETADFELLNQHGELIDVTKDEPHVSIHNPSLKFLKTAQTTMMLSCARENKRRHYFQLIFITNQTSRSHVKRAC
jgi:hypothetical protein